MSMVIGIDPSHTLINIKFVFCDTFYRSKLYANMSDKINLSSEHLLVRFRWLKSLQARTVGLTS